MEFIFVLAIAFFQVFFIHVLQVMEIVRALRVYTLVDDKVLTVFLVCQGIAAMGAAQGIVFGKAVVIRGEVGITDLALDLPLSPIVTVEVGLWGIAAGAGAVLGDIAFPAPGNGPDLFVVPVFKVRYEELPVPSILVELYFGEFIRFEFLVLWGESPLFKRDIFADEIDEPAILPVKVLN